VIVSIISDVVPRGTPPNVQPVFGVTQRPGSKFTVLFYLHEAATVFADPLAVTYRDPDHTLSEERFITVGMSRNGRVCWRASGPPPQHCIVIVAHSDRGENIRIISARKTTLGERKHYEEEN
jgi:uncharacterized protein